MQEILYHLTLTDMQHWGFPTDISAAGYWVDRVFWLAFWLVVAAFTAVIVTLGYVLIRYHARPGHHAAYRTLP